MDLLEFEVEEDDTNCHVWAIDGDYSDQEYVDLACLVDPGRELKFDTQQPRKSKTIEVMIDSFKLPPNVELENYQSKRPPMRAPDTIMHVYKEWLKNYLDFFEPGYYEFIITSLEGLKVTVLPDHLASNNIHEYQMQGREERHHEVVPLWKGHKVLLIENQFVYDYATKLTAEEFVETREFNKEAGDCNPSAAFEEIPFPKCKMGREKSDVPDSFFQITGVRAEVMKRKGWTTPSARKGAHNKKAHVSQFIIRWLGIQNSKYVSLPEEWVHQNIDKDICDEAVRRGKAKMKGDKYTGGIERFVKLPPGDTRDDDPPEHLRNAALGYNYY
jgi:hypothetical protein